MSLVDKYVDITNAIRDQYGTTDKYHLSDIPAMIDGLAINNLFPANVTYDSTVDESWGKILGISIDDWNNCIGETVTISFDLEWQNWDGTDQRNRIGVEWGLFVDDKDATWANAWIYPETASGKQHVSNTIYIPNKKIINIQENSFFNQINSSAKVKATNFKLVINPMGGVKPTPPNLLFNARSKYLPNATVIDNFDCNLTDPSSTIHMESGSTYEVIAETNGYFSGDHEPNVESDKCVLFLTDSVTYSQIISRDSTATGSQFVWNGPSGTFYLRVNAYHKAGKNTICAYNIRIYKIK